MQISVIIPMYNSKDVIIDALESVRNQTATEYILEVIVVNDGSTDGSDIIVKKYIDSEKVPYNIVLLNQQNQGVSAARNAGMKKAKGDWIALLDSDDEWMPNKIQRQVDVIKQNPQIDVFGANDRDGGLWLIYKYVTMLHKISVCDMLIRSFPPTSTIIFRREIYDKLGGFDETKHYCEDQEYWHRIVGYYNFYYMPECLTKYGHGKRSFGISGLSKNMQLIYENNIDNIQRLYDRRDVSYCMYVFFRAFHMLKNMRRQVIAYLNI